MSYEDKKETSSIFGHDYKGRKLIPIYSFLTRYFPKALVAVVNVCVAGNKQHNKDLDPTDIHWAREKSTDQLNTAMRHLIDHGTMGPFDDDGQLHLAKAAWRVLAELELLIEKNPIAVAEAPKAGVRDTSQPIPADVIQKTCKCGSRVFAYREGDLIPSVVDPYGAGHSPDGCTRTPLRFPFRGD